MHRVICQAAEMWSRKMQRSWWMLLRLLRFQIPSRMGFGQRRIGQEQGQMVAWEHDDDFWWSKVTEHKSLCSGIYRDGDTKKVVGDGDAFGSCVLQQPVELVLTPQKKEPAMVEVGLLPLWRTLVGRSVHSHYHSSWDPFDLQLQVFHLPHMLQTLEPQHQQGLNQMPFSSHHYQQLAHWLVESCQDLQFLHLPSLSLSPSFLHTLSHILIIPISHFIPFLSYSDSPCPSL